VYLFKPMVSAHAMLIDRAAFNLDALHRTHPFDWLVSLDAAFAGGIAWVPDAITFHRIHGSNQSNGRSGRKLALRERYAWPELRRRFAVRGTERWMLVQRLEYLSHAAAVDSGLRQTFRHAHDACVTAWFDQNRALETHNRHLLTRLLNLLLPVAATPAEARFAERELRRLARAAADPFNIAWQVGSFLRGRRTPRQSRSRN